MNERIEKLAEQAGMIVDKYGLARDAENGLEDGVDIYKFAELIVRECIHAVENTNDRYRRDYFAAKIREHFGVEL